jgi:hypothetical protein
MGFSFVRKEPYSDDRQKCFEFINTVEVYDTLEPCIQSIFLKLNSDVKYCEWFLVGGRLKGCIFFNKRISRQKAETYLPEHIIIMPTSRGWKTSYEIFKKRNKIKVIIERTWGRRFKNAPVRTVSVGTQTPIMQ